MFQSEQSDTKDSGLVQTLTLGATPAKPALEIDQDLIRKADDIFGREQEAVVQAATRQPKQPDLYVNDYGYFPFLLSLIQSDGIYSFLTQTRPNEDAEIYQIPTSQHPSSQQTELPAHSPQRHPLQPIGPSSPAFTQTPLRRLRRRSSTPTPNPSPVKRLFIAPSPNEKRQRNKQPFDKSEFIADEANESDDDEIMGFGLGPDNRHEGDPEEEGVELDRHDERLVNDAFMDEATLAEQRVKDKARFVLISCDGRVRLRLFVEGA
jgi:mediator of replication checkpoint protein 1